MNRSSETNPASSPAEPTAGPAPDIATPRGAVVAPIGLLLLAVLPDSMVVPVLSELFVDRYGVTAATAHWFMAINVIGGACILPLLAVARRRMNPAALIAIASTINAGLLAAMAGPVTFAGILALRFFEGAADLVVIAMLFHVISRAGPAERGGARLGAAGTVLMFGLGLGIVLGGQVGANRPTDVFLVGCGLGVIVALLASRCGALFSTFADAPASPASASLPDAHRTDRPRLWPTLLMSFSDRAVGGLMAVTLPFYFASIWQIEPTLRGWLIGLPLLVMAGGAWPAGWFGDRVGHMRLRTVSAVLYAGSLAALPTLAGAPKPAIFAVMAMLGVGGAALLPASLTLAGRSGRGATAMGGHRVAGEFGYLLGLGAAGTLLSLVGGDEPSPRAYHIVIVGFAALHVAFTLIAWRAHARRS